MHEAAHVPASSHAPPTETEPAGFGAGSHHGDVVSGDQLHHVHHAFTHAPEPGAVDDSRANGAMFPHQVLQIVGDDGATHEIIVPQVRCKSLDVFLGSTAPNTEDSALSVRPTRQLA